MLDQIYLPAVHNVSYRITVCETTNIGGDPLPLGWKNNSKYITESAKIGGRERVTVKVCAPVVESTH